MSHLALYREWRPQRFSEVVGQAHVVTTLKNALSQGKLAHAYLFAGPRGTGKTSVAKILAKAVNCERAVDGEPCNDCPACRGIVIGQVVDVVEMDAASNRGIDEIRSLLEQVRYVPTEVRNKVFIIDEVHMLTPEAFNALLKTLEEPPEYCLFILATTESHKVPATVASRCQRFDFGRVKTDLIVQRLREVVNSLPVSVEDAALWFIARTTEGGLRDALSLLDQTISFADGHVGVEAVAEVLGGVTSEQLGHLYACLFADDAHGLLIQLQMIWERGQDPVQLIGDLIAYGRDAILLKHEVNGEDADSRKQYDPTFPIVVQNATVNRIFRIVERMAYTQTELRFQSQGRLYVEVALLAMTRKDVSSVGDAQSDLCSEVAALTKRVQELEQRPNPVPSSSEVTAIREAVFERSDGFARGGSELATVAAGNPSRTEISLGTGSAVQKPSRRPLSAVMSSEEQVLLAQIQEHWSAILEQLKQRSIQTRAWLYAGKAVAVTDGQLIVAFKSSIHAETVMRPAHKEHIESVLLSVTGHPLLLCALLDEAWERLRALVPPLVPVEPVITPREPWVQKVVEWFGDERVIVDDSEGDNLT